MYVSCSGEFDVKKFRESKLKPQDGALHMAFMQVARPAAATLQQQCLPCCWLT